MIIATEIGRQGEMKKFIISCKKMSTPPSKMPSCRPDLSVVEKKSWDPLECRRVAYASVKGLRRSNKWVV